MRIPFITLIGASALALGGCAYGDLGLGMGYGDPYSGYGYGSSYYGAGYGGYYGGYGYGSPYYGGYGSPYGWYDNYYYPGTGIYVYDSYRRPRQWTNSQKSYWTSRQRLATTSGTKTVSARPNWSGFRTRQQQQQQVQTRDQERQQHKHRSY
ncbi:MAG: hypothetical protein ABI454_05260 [Sphingomicrobium sp.]